MGVLPKCCHQECISNYCPNCGRMVNPLNSLVRYLGYNIKQATSDHIRQKWITWHTSLVALLKIAPKSLLEYQKELTDIGPELDWLDGLTMLEMKQHIIRRVFNQTQSKTDTAKILQIGVRTVHSFLGD